MKDNIDTGEKTNAGIGKEPSDLRFRNLIIQIPIAMVVLRGPQHVVEIANSAMLKRWGLTEEDVVGRAFVDIFPHIKDTKIPGLLNEVYTTGVPYRETESVSYIQSHNGAGTSYVDFEYSPLHELDGTVSGVIATVSDVSEKVKARQRIEESDLFNRTVLESSPDCVKLLDLDGKVSFINVNGVCTLEAENKDVFLNRKWETMWGSENRPRVVKAIADALLGKTTQFKAQANTVKGNAKWWEVFVTPIVDSKQQVISIMASSRDITESLRREQELTESEKKFRLLADSMPQHIWTADALGNLNYYNQSVYDYSGLTPDELERGGWLQIVHPDDRDANVREWMFAVATGNDFLFEHRFLKHTGEYRWQLSRAIPQRDDEGKIQMWVGTSTDIQNQKSFTKDLERLVRERTKELAENNIELEKMNAELQSFAYISSHDLQEPLRKIQTFSSRLHQKEYAALSESGRDQLKRMQVAAERMQALINDLLAYSRTTTAERKFEKISLDKVIDEVKEDLKEEIKEKGAMIETIDICDVTIIPFQFRQLIQNLVSNALKFAQTDRPPHIKIQCATGRGTQLPHAGLRADKEYCHITISDNGIGFEPQYNEKIFGLFQRLHGRSEYNGTGIGLAIVKKIVENHKGIVVAKGQPGKGATFEIFIPMA
ncbi:MAG TPA: PAS domain-containing protein [Chitinophagales bacterium]|nr:PAS domain-containing protein [Chitinophagales bacterium]